MNSDIIAWIICSIIYIYIPIIIAFLLSNILDKTVYKILECRNMHDTYYSIICSFLWPIILLAIPLLYRLLFHIKRQATYLKALPGIKLGLILKIIEKK
jgi:hypothetical protein